MELTIDPARMDERATLERLLQLYLHDFSSFAEPDSPYGDVEADGRFAFPDLERYWLTSDHQAFLMRRGGLLAGFALLNRWAPSGAGVDFAIAEFFVLRKYRRIGLGRAAARRLIAERPGRWEVGVAAYNSPAIAFWRATLTELDGWQVREGAGDDERWRGPIFALRPPA
ncbi:MAG: GNAT family N-acetyltransferase [Marivibrio sp.]|uniref:GNAT family N-acetyltransferase n=1 Tax=Marivibrio sp. TaxID=2039719 RepID=UPI0032EC381A